MGYAISDDNASVIDCRSKRVWAQTVKQRMRGVSHADLIDTTDGLYITKWKQNPVHRRVLMNSLIGAELLRRNDIAVPEWAFVVADAEFCRRSGSDRPLLRAGVHFGLRRPGPCTTPVYDVLPRALSRRVINQADFVRAMVFDCWVDNAKPRQAVFTGSSAGFYGQMIGNGHILGFRNGSWSFDAQPGLRIPLPLATCVYLENSAAECIENTIVHIQNSAHSSLEMISRVIPEDWLEADCAEITCVFEHLLRRATALPELIRTALADFRQSESRGS